MSSSLISLDEAPPETSAEVVSRRRRWRVGPRVLDPVAVALLTIGVSAAGASRPSFWFDEAATISASTRTLPELWRLLGHIDAVHGLYYLMMHGWFAVFPVTEFSSRAPSCLAAGAAGAGVVVLARQFSGRSVALCAGTVFAILPRTTWAGVEARSYALTAVAAVWLTVLLVAAVKRHRWWPWLLYALMFPVALVLNTFLLLLVVVHAGVISVLSPARSAVIGWVTASLVGAGLAAPFVIFTQTQFAQVAWIPPLSADSVVEVLQSQYFDGSTPFAIVAGVLVATALMLRVFGATPHGEGTGRLLVVSAAWITIPTVALLVYTEFAAPLYHARYLCFTAPAMALLLGVCITAIARTRMPMAGVLLALTVVAAPNYVLAQRGPYKSQGMDYSEVADVVTHHAKPGDCLLLDNTTSWRPGPIRPLLAARPGAYRGLDDLGRGTPATSSDQLWDGFVPLWTVQDRLTRCTVLWTISERDRTLGDHDGGDHDDRDDGGGDQAQLAPGPRLGGAPVYQIPFRMGFRIVERWQFSFAQIVESTR